MTILSGKRLGPYEILSIVGAGGTGEVYPAKDTRLDRIVAITVLPPHLAGRAELRERFEREAKAISSLGERGRRDARLKGCKRPLPLELRYAVEIAEALDAATVFRLT